MGYGYRYLRRGDGCKPLAHCPECGAYLMRHGLGVVIEFVSDCGSRHWDVESRLDDEGYLLDPTGEVAQGYHSGTFCAGCGELLINMDVIEQDADEERDG